MSRWAWIGGGLGVLALVALVGVGGAAFWAVSARDAALSQTFEVHAGSFPVPPPLTEAELAQLRAERAPAPADPAAPPVDPLAGLDLDAIALERAIARGKHLVEARYACVECHGDTFGGGTMIDDPAIGKVLGPNLTTGAGSATATYQPQDWDRKVRHGVRPDGHSGLMPSEDYVYMSDRELGDIVAYIRSLPPVDREVEPVTLGPVGTMLVATGQLAVATTRLEQRDQHEALPPEEGPTEEFGRHIAMTCVGCHRKDFSGGPILGAPPDWAPAANLTPHEQGLAGWTFEDFDKTMRSGVRPDGTPMKQPMIRMLRYGAATSEVEMRAMWAHLSSLPPVPDGV
jgi:mono/diheme cytochrome c family protein